MLRKIRDGAVRGRVEVHPLRLYDRDGFALKPWDLLTKRFLSDRQEWSGILGTIDLNAEIKTPTRIHTAVSLTEKLVRHEARHLDDLKDSG
ncbi:MAG: hypothetical protein JST30_15870 [Armatimonadetes bacterium]|nr:hypothetical protein [Armatimonadota bacterium]